MPNDNNSWGHARLLSNPARQMPIHVDFKKLLSYGHPPKAGRRLAIIHSCAIAHSAAHRPPVMDRPKECPLMAT